MVRVDSGRYAGYSGVALKNHNTDIRKKMDAFQNGQTAEKDSVEIFAGKEAAPGESGDAVSVKDYIRYLEEMVPGRKIAVADLNGEAAIGKYAISHQGTFQIVISQKALEKMMTDPEFEKKCIDALKTERQAQAEKLAGLPAQGKRLLGCGLALGEDGEISQWVLTQKQDFQSMAGRSEKEQKDASSRNKKEEKLFNMVKKKVTYVPAKDLIKIARAVNRQAVRKTISGIQAQISQLKAGGGEKEVRAAYVKQAEQVLLKAKLKDRQLKKEELLKLQQKRAFEKAEYEKSLQLKQLLKRKREGRKVREYGQIRDYYETPQQRQREEERLANCFPAVTGGYEGSAVDTGMTGIGGADLDTAAMGGEISLDITVS